MGLLGAFSLVLLAGIILSAVIFPVLLSGLHSRDDEAAELEAKVLEIFGEPESPGEEGEEPLSPPLPPAYNGGDDETSNLE